MKTADHTTRWGLSPAEFVVMQMSADGMSAKEIARALRRSPPTIQTHREHAKEKMGARNGVHAAVLFDRAFFATSVKGGAPAQPATFEDRMETRADRVNRILIEKLRAVMPHWKESA